MKSNLSYEILGELPENIKAVFAYFTEEEYNKRSTNGAGIWIHGGDVLFNTSTTLRIHADENGVVPCKDGNNPWSDSEFISVRIIKHRDAPLLDLPDTHYIYGVSIQPQEDVENRLVYAIAPKGSEAKGIPENHESLYFKFPEKS